MLGWAAGFFIAALVAAVFGFGAVASAFANIALILFWVFVALFVLSVVLSLFSGRGGHAGHAAGGGGRTLGLIAVAALVGVLAYAWVDNDWTAQDVGREIDQGASDITAEAAQAIEGAGDRAEELVDDTRNETSEALDEASDNVASENNN